MHHTGFAIPRIKLEPLEINPNYALHKLGNNIKLSSTDKKKGLVFPEYLPLELAEEIGIHYGDGFLSNKKSDFRVKGHKIDERDYYLNFIKPLYRSLFNIELNLKEYETTYGFELYSKALCEFKTKVVKIQPGRKDNIILPELIKNNCIQIKMAFIRGLFDTDGNVDFSSRYGRKNYYPIISVWQKSEKLVLEVVEILRELG